ncbi:phage baseplate assembly protein V [Salmonella enterica]|nr:phage baseplate assembly protein V [Salmonella enterica subsp. diarizonae serovar 48:i:z]EEH1874123.1 phage baseplate assembly protein V [Salmonella enterica]EEM2739574.1 phage baseplate assembly protein V [Salmonella enterica]EEM9676972.1 phage baseplate assembly protein V [Salmonella enterica]EEN5962865.1 phage baseplate assembly protein V [Salmonella enterica]
MNAELMRLMGNVIRTGIIFAIDADAWRVRVQSGELKTTWLRWNTARAGAFKIWMPPAIGEQVLIACIGGNPETAMIIGSLYSSDNPAPGSSLKEMVITAPDGAVIRYDAGGSALTATGMKTASLEASVSVTLKTPVVECTQHLKAATFEITKGGKMTGSVEHSGGSFTSNGVQVDNHGHGGVKPGDSWTQGTR